MSPGADDYRLAVAVFDEPESLWNAVDTLLSDGLGLDQLCLVAMQQTMARLEPPMQAGVTASLLPALLSSVNSWQINGTGKEIVATSGLVLEALRHVLDGGRATISNGHGASPLRPEIADHILPDAVTLVVRSKTPAQQSLTARTLLSRSSHRVKTFEFTYAPKPSAPPAAGR